MKRLILAAAAISALAAGCRTTSYYGTQQAVSVPQGFDKTVIEEATVALTKAFPPGKTTFFFPYRDEPIAAAIEQRLRRSGYAFMNERPSASRKDVVEIGYTLDGVGADASLVVFRLVAGPHWQMSRVYQRQKDGAMRAFGPAVLRRG